MENRLEKIICIEGKFFDKEGNEIKPKAVGNPVIITTDINQKMQIKDKLIEKNKTFIKNHKINAYIKGQVYNYYEEVQGQIVCLTSFTPFQFYKI